MLSKRKVASYFICLEGIIVIQEIEFVVQSVLYKNQKRLFNLV